MTDKAEIIIDILNELLAAESTGLIPRLNDIGTYIPPDAVETGEFLSRLCADRPRNADALIDEILRLHGTPDPRTADSSTTNLHYLDVRFLLPRILAEQHRIVDLYESALGRVPSPADASATLVRELSAAHRESLTALERLAQGCAGAPPL